MGEKHSQFEATRYAPIIQDLNQEILQIKGLEKGMYMLKIDGLKIASFNADALKRN